MKIHMLLLGGGIPPYVAFLPTAYSSVAASPSATTTAVSNTKTESDKNLLTDKDLLTMLDKIDGLPSDMDVLRRQLILFYRFDDGTSDASTLALRYINTLYLVKVANNNKKEFDKAYTSINSKDGLGEYAITDTGKIACMDLEGKVHYLTPELFKSSGEYQALTNSNILSMRANNVPMDNSLLQIVSNGTSLAEVDKLIQQYKHEIGSKTYNDAGYHTSDQAKAMKGVRILEEIAAKGGDGSNMSLDGLYKTEIKSKDLQEAVEYTMRYIYAMLPNNAKTLLKLHSDGTDKGIATLITNSIMGQLNSSLDFNTTFLVDANGNKLGKNGTNSGSGGGEGTDMNPAIAFALLVGETDTQEFNTGTAYSIKALAVRGILSDAEGKPLGNNSTLQDASSSSFAGVLNLKQATMGGLLLNSRGLDHILLDDSQIYSMALPCIKENGVVKPDFSLCGKVEKAEEEISNKGIEDANQINAIYKKYGLPDKYDKNGKLNTFEYARFAAIQGTTDAGGFNDEAPSMLDDTVKIVDDDSVRSGYEATMKKKDDKYSLSGGFLGLGEDQLYSGTIFIPINENVIMASLGSKDYFKLPTKSANDVLERLRMELMGNTPAYNKPQSLSSLMK